jgi:hypothetical protein
VQGDRGLLTAVGPRSGYTFEDPHAFVELIQELLDQGTTTVVLDLPPRPGVTARPAPCSDSGLGSGDSLQLRVRSMFLGGARRALVLIVAWRLQRREATGGRLAR